MIKTERIVFNWLQENTYILSDESGQCAIIDPGCATPAECAALDKHIADNNLTPTRLLFTHLHLDHIFGATHVMQRYGLTATANTSDTFLFGLNQQMADMWGLGITVNQFAIENPINDGDTVAFGNSALTCLHVPGHSPGSIVFYSESDNLCISGDVLFQMSIGRSDLPGGDEMQLISGIQRKLLTLPAETVVMPGHGGYTTIGNERTYNPIVAMR